jgi:Bacterial membrane protein YfhO
LSKVEQPDAPILQAMQVNTLIANDPLPASAEATWELVHSTPPLVYKRRIASERFHFVESVLQVNAMSDAVAAARASGWSPQTVAIVEQGRRNTVTQPSSVGSVAVLQDHAGETRLHTVNSKAGFLFVSEAYYPGWRAQVDNKPTPILPTNIGYQGLWIPAGEHNVALVYSPTIFAMGGALSIATLIGLVVGLIWTRSRKESKSFHTHS